MSKVIRLDNNNEMLLKEYKRIWKKTFPDTSIELKTQQILSMCIVEGIRSLEKRIGGK